MLAQAKGGGSATYTAELPSGVFAYAEPLMIDGAGREKGLASPEPRRS
jgi:hypothetical protein